MGLSENTQRRELLQRLTTRPLHANSTLALRAPLQRLIALFVPQGSRPLLLVLDQSARLANRVDTLLRRARGRVPSATLGPHAAKRQLLAR